MSVESMATDPYEVVLNDLRAKKAQIEQAISAIEAIRGGVSSVAISAASSPPGNSQNSDIDSPGAFLGMSIVDAAKKLLAAKRQPLRNPDIASAFKRGGLAMNSKDAVNTIGSVLTRRANEVGDLVKVDRGTWGLKEWYPNRSFKKGVPTESVKAETAVPEEGTIASTSFMITMAQREKLKQAGMTEDDIKTWLRRGTRGGTERTWRKFPRMALLARGGGVEGHASLHKAKIGTGHEFENIAPLTKCSPTSRYQARPASIPPHHLNSPIHHLSKQDDNPEDHGKGEDDAGRDHGLSVPSDHDFHK